jgi:dimethylargininase
MCKVGLTAALVAQHCYQNMMNPVNTLPAAPVFAFDAAIVRLPSETVVSGLRAGDGGDPDYAGVRAEHTAYVAALGEAGVMVTTLGALEGYPDAVFVEDPALVYPEGAILLRPGAKSRAGEVSEIAGILREHFTTVLELPEGGYVEGGDILTTPKKVMIGLSNRTDVAGASALQKLLAEFGRASEIVETPADVLHFKTDCSLLDEETVLSTARLARSGVFDGFDVVLTPKGEEAAANALRVNDVVMVGADFPRTIETLDKRGYTVVALKTTQIGKIDAGLSCMSLRWRRASQ